MLLFYLNSVQIFGAVFHFGRAPVEDVLDVHISPSFVFKYYTLIEEYPYIMFLCSHVPYEINHTFFIHVTELKGHLKDIRMFKMEDRICIINCLSLVTHLR